ncbi:IS5 family transposase [Streptomyces inhibens]|nr:IS5 family transposase [Streptomyces inhibens]
MINDIPFRLRTGIPWRDLPARFGKRKTVHDRQRRWSADGTWGEFVASSPSRGRCGGRIDWTVVSVDSTSCRAHQHAAGARRRSPRVPGRRRQPAWHRSDEALGRSRGGFTPKIHLASEDGRRPLAFVITPGQWGDAPQMIQVLDHVRVPRPSGGHPRTRPDHPCADRAYSSRRNRRHLRRRQIEHTIPEPPTSGPTVGGAVARAAAPPPGFNREVYRRRNEAERTILTLKGFRAVATRFEKRTYVFHGTVTVAAIRRWLRT